MGDVCRHKVDPIVMWPRLQKELNEKHLKTETGHKEKFLTNSFYPISTPIP